MALRHCKLNQNGAQSEQNGAEGGPKAPKMEPKESQKQPKGNPEAKREPKSDQNALKNQSSEKIAKRVSKRSPVRDFAGAFLDHFSRKSTGKIEYGDFLAPKIDLEWPKVKKKPIQKSSKIRHLKSKRKT